MVRAAFLAISLLMASPAAAEKPKGVPTPLTSIGAVSNSDAPLDPDDPGTGGSFDSTTYFRNRLTSPTAIAACATKIEQVAAAWATKFTLSRASRDAEPTSLSLQYVKAGQGGLFEVTYKVVLQTRARVTVSFYAQDGTALDPAETKTMLSAYDIDAFEDALDTALRCGGKAA